MVWNWLCLCVVFVLEIEFVFVTVSCLLLVLMHFFSRLGGCKGKRMVYSRDNDSKAKQG